MKRNAFNNLLFLSTLLISTTAQGQGVFIYDQQSANESNSGEGAAYIQSLQPLGQSFTPTNSSVGFIRLILFDSSVNSLGAAVYLNLRSDSITGAVLAATAPVIMPDGFGQGTNGVVNFFFSSPVSVTPNVTYYFQPVVQSGDTWGAAADVNFHYSGGTAFFNGTANTSWDLWFREGIIVPEPSSVLLALLGGSAMVWLRREVKRHTVT